MERSVYLHIISNTHDEKFIYVTFTFNLASLLLFSTLDQKNNSFYMFLSILLLFQIVYVNTDGGFHGNPLMKKPGLLQLMEKIAKQVSGNNLNEGYNMLLNI